MTSNVRPRSIPADRISIQVVDTETLVYDESRHKAFCLNRISACIWRLSNGLNTVPQMAAAASVELGSPISEDIVLLTLAELRENELLQPDPAEILPHGISRREMIGRAGLTAAALLPLITALAAPPAAAQGGSLNGSARRTDSIGSSLK